MRWHKDSRYRAGGFWECYPKMRARKWKYHIDRGWKTKRLSQLKRDRADVLRQLDELGGNVGD